ncbi:ParA family protein [Acidocella facilis]|uniref:ParA family protein n=1 Tax=Acidocella facilis TaxID=525 RepID=UPI0004792B2E|nr:ParA family protein [Acidocella facilis]
MQIITIAATKGGVGKTTLAAALATAALVARPGIRVGLVDLDPQGSLTAWWNRRDKREPQLLRQPEGDFRFDTAGARAAGFDLIVIDCPPGFSDILADAIATADLVLIPTGPSMIDLDAIEWAETLAETFSMTRHFVLNQAIYRSRLAGRAVRELSERGHLLRQVVHHRVAIAEAMRKGLTAIEAEPTGAAARELAALWAEVGALLGRVP